jgi:hypothetical protein
MGQRRSGYSSLKFTCSQVEGFAFGGGLVGSRVQRFKSSKVQKFRCGAHSRELPWKGTHFVETVINLRRIASEEQLVCSQNPIPGMHPIFKFSNFQIFKFTHRSPVP